MRDQISSHYFVNTDFELAMKLSDQIKDKGIDNFYELEKFLKDRKIVSFDDLLKFVTGPDCSSDIAIARCV